MAKVKVFVDRLGKSKSLDVKNISEIFEKLGLDIGEYIIVREGTLITENTKLRNNDDLKLLSAVSSG